MTKEYIEISLGEWLQDEFLTPLKMSQNALARAIHVPPNRIHAIINNTRRITADTDLRLCKFFGMSNNFFLRVQDEIETRAVQRKIQQDLDTIVPYVQTHAQENDKHLNL